MLLSDCIEFNAIKFPDRPALIFEDVISSYSTLRSRVRRVANAIATLAAPGDRVALLSENRREYIECLYGVPRAGTGLCLLNYRLSDFELQRIIIDAEPSVVIVESEHLSTIVNIRDAIPFVRTIVVIGGEIPDGMASFDVLMQSVTDDEATIEVDETSLAWLIYTSGTTGVPKGVMLSHRNVLAAVTNTMPYWIRRPGNVLLAPWPMCHVAAQVNPMVHILGWTVVLMRAYSPLGFLEHVERYRCTSSTGAPTMLSMLMNHPRFSDFDLSSLRTISYGSSAMPPAVLRRAMTLMPNTGFATNFGMTEVAGAVFYFDAPEHVEALLNNPDALMSVGHQLPLSVTRLVDEDMNDVAPGEVGEIVVRGPQVTLGYWRNPSANEEAFRGGWFHTGDLARVGADGYTYIVDRKKDMIITGGLNVYSREVELILSTHPSVQEVAVVGVPDETWGESVVAFIQVRPGTALDSAELIALCREKLAHYKKPKYVVEISELPKSPLGKVLKRELRDRVQSGDVALKNG